MVRLNNIGLRSRKMITTAKVILCLSHLVDCLTPQKGVFGYAHFYIDVDICFDILKENNAKTF